MDYKSPARYGDTLTITTTVTDVSAVRIDLSCQIHNQHKTLVANARTVLAFIDTNFKPSQIPADMRAMLMGKKD
jgi:acyl-CoA thioesterase FadM